MPKKDMLIQEREKGPYVLASHLVEKYTREGREITRIGIPQSHYEECVYRRKRVLGIFGTKKTVVNERIEWTELIQAWSVFPDSVLDSDDLFARYLAEDGRVFDKDIDFGWTQA